jgi:hypothetical protein
MGTLTLRKKWKNESSTKNQWTLQFAGSTDKSEISSDFFGSNVNNSVNGRLVGKTQGANGVYNYTILWSVPAELAKKAKAGMTADEILLTAEDRAEGITVQPYIVRTTYNAGWSSLTPVMNPDTKEVKTYMGKPLYEYKTLTDEQDATFEHIGHDCPEWLEPVTVDIADEEDIF